jgi:hypothetical protein
MSTPSIAELSEFYVDRTFMLISEPTPGIEIVDDLQRAHLEMWTEGERSPRPEFTHEQLRDIERIAAADLVSDMRNVESRAARWSEDARLRYERRFDSLALEFSNAASSLRKLRADRDFVPPFLRPHLTVVK